MDDCGERWNIEMVCLYLCFVPSVKIENERTKFLIIPALVWFMCLIVAPFISHPLAWCKQKGPSRLPKESVCAPAGLRAP